MRAHALPYRSGLVLPIVLVLLLGWRADRSEAAPLTFNTALPVAAGQVMIRLDAMVMGAGAYPMSQELTAVAVPGAVVYGLSRKVALITMGTLFISKSLDLDMPMMGRITRRASGLGDLTFLARYELVEIDHPGSTFRLAPFAGVQAPTGHARLSDRFGVIPRPLQPGSGAWDPIVGSIATWQTLRWEVDTDAGAQLNQGADGFRFGNQVFADQSFQYRLWPRSLGEGTPGFLYGVLESNVQWQGASVSNGTEVESAGTNWLGDVGLEYVRPQYVLEVAVQIPLVTHGLNGTSLHQHYAVFLGFRWNLFTRRHF